MTYKVGDIVTITEQGMQLGCCKDCGYYCRNKVLKLVFIMVYKGELSYYETDSRHHCWMREKDIEKVTGKAAKVLFG